MSKKTKEVTQMVGLGTVINAAGVIVGGILGMLFGKRLKTRYREILQNSAGICVLFLGIGGAMEQMLKITDGTLKSGGSMMLVVSLCLGGIIGEFLNIEGRTEQFGEWLKRKTKSDGDTGFVDGFVTTSLTICIGAMAIVGSIQDGIYGDFSVLTIKAILDLIIVTVLSASKGKGCIFSVIPVVILQGSVTALSKLIAPLMTEAAIAALSFVGSVLIFCVGVNLVFGKKVKVANLLPSLLIAIMWTMFVK